MIKNFFMSVIFSAILILNSAVYAAENFPEILATSAILIESSTGRVIFEKNADEFRSPASMTKIMTCILGIENLSPTTEIKISSEAANTEFSDLHLQTGEIISADNLMLGTMLVSDNGGAVAIAQAVGGNISNFAKMMNDKAKEIGCENTNFVNPNGLTVQNHGSTARDMSKIAAYCMKNETFRRYVGTNLGIIQVTNPPRNFSALNTNKLLETYQGSIGIKTGYTYAAGGCLASSAKRGDIELISIVMNSPTNDTRFDDSVKILDYGFAKVDYVKKIEIDEIDQIVFVRGGKSGTLHVEPTEDLYFPIFKDEDEKLLTITYDLPKIVDAEIKRGDIIGEAILNYDGKKVASVQLAAIENISEGFSFSSAIVAFSENFSGKTQNFLLNLVA